MQAPVQEALSAELGLHEALLEQGRQPEERRETEPADEHCGAGHQRPPAASREHDEPQRRQHEQSDGVVRQRDQCHQRRPERNAAGRGAIECRQQSEQRHGHDCDRRGFSKGSTHVEIQRQVGREQPDGGAAERRGLPRSHTPAEPEYRHRSEGADQRYTELQGVGETAAGGAQRSRNEVEKRRCELEQRLTKAGPEIRRPQRGNLPVAQPTVELDDPRRIGGGIVAVDELATEERVEREQGHSRQRQRRPRAGGVEALADAAQALRRRLPESPPEVCVVRRPRERRSGSHRQGESA